MPHKFEIFYHAQKRKTLVNNIAFKNNFCHTKSHYLQHIMNFTCTEDDDAMTRGRILAHYICTYHKSISSLIKINNLRRTRKSTCNRRRRYAKKKSRSMMINMLQTALLHHHYSYDNVTRPSMPLNVTPLISPLETITTHQFYKNAGLWRTQFKEIMDNLTLVPNTIIHPHSRCKAMNELAL